MNSLAPPNNLYLAHQLSSETQAQLSEWSRVVAEEPPLPPVRWHLRRDAYLRHAAIGASIRIEGNSLSNAQTDALLEGDPVDAPATQRLEATNYDNALGLASTFARDPGFEWSEMVFRVVNGAVMRDLTDDTHGQYRDGPVSVGTVYEGPGHRFVGALMASLVAWLRETDDHPLIRTALLHLNLVAVHPWFNGNGRSARILSQLELMRVVRAPELISIEPALEAQQDRYYERIRTALGPTFRPDEHSVSEWIEWYVGLHTERLEEGQRLNNATMHDIVTVLGALERRSEPSDWGPIVHLAAFGPFVTRQVSDAYGNSPSAARALAARLVAAGWITPEGATRGRRYVGTERVRGLQLRGPELMNRWARVGTLGLDDSSRPGADA
jgi:Fic family protein